MQCLYETWNMVSQMEWHFLAETADLNFPESTRIYLNRANDHMHLQKVFSMIYGIDF